MSTGFNAICDDCKTAVHLGFLASGGSYAGYSSHDWVGQRRALAFVFHHAYAHTVRIAQNHPSEYRFLEDDEIDPDTGEPVDPEEEAVQQEIESDQALRRRWFVGHFAHAVLDRQWTPADVPHLRALGVPEDLLPGALSAGKVVLDPEQRALLRLALVATWEGGGRPRALVSVLAPLVHAGLVREPPESAIAGGTSPVVLTPHGEQIARTIE